MRLKEKKERFMLALKTATPQEWQMLQEVLEDAVEQFPSYGKRYAKHAEFCEKLLKELE